MMMRPIPTASAIADKLLSVDEVKVYKPHPQTYQLVIDTLNVTKSEVSFVTSNYFDVAGAKSFGFNVFWINRSNAIPDELGLLPDVTLDRLTGLPEGIRDWRRGCAGGRAPALRLPECASP
jgi:FMN phosphatase YigB (HAD superfamily)